MRVGGFRAAGRAVAHRIGKLRREPRLRASGHDLPPSSARAERWPPRRHRGSPRGRRALRAPAARRRSCRPVTSPRRGAPRDSRRSRPSSVAAPSSVWQTSAAAVGAGQADEHAGFGHGLREQEHVRRPGAREPGDRVEVGLGHAHDGAHRARAPARRVRGAIRRRALPAAIAAAPLPTSAPVLGIARTTGRSPAPASTSASVTPAAIDSTSACSGRIGAQASSAAGDVARLDRDHDDVGVGRRPGGARDHAHSGEPLLEHPPALAVDLRDRDACRCPSRRRSAPARAPRPFDRHRGAQDSSGSGVNRCPRAACDGRTRERVRARGTLESPRTSPNGVTLLHLGPSTLRRPSAPLATI